MRTTKQMLRNKMKLVEKMLDLPANSLCLYSHRPDKRRLYQLQFSYDFKEKSLKDRNFWPFFSNYMYANELYHLLEGILAG